VLLGVPLYTNVVGVIPLVAALQAKGLAMGTLLAFMMSVVALSLPEMILLRRVLKPQLIAIFVAIVATGIVGVGTAVQRGALRAPGGGRRARQGPGFGLRQLPPPDGQRPLALQPRA
jgi:hypothetical protein